MRSCAQDPDPPGGVLDDRQHEQVPARHGDRLEEIAGEQGSGLGAEEIGPGGSGAVGCRVDPGVVEKLPYGGRGDLDAEDEQFAVDAAVAPGRVLSCQAQYQLADGADGTADRGAWAGIWPRGGAPAGPGASAGPFPAWSAVGSGGARRAGGGAQGGQECPVGGGEPRPVRAQLPLQDRDLMPERQDLDVLVPVAH